MNPNPHASHAGVGLPPHAVRAAIYIAAMDAAAFRPRAVVVLRELEPAARRRYVTMLADRKVQSARDGAAWVANLRILAPGVDAPHATEKPATKARRPLGDRLQAARTTETPPPDLAGINTLAYPRFASLIWRAVGTQPAAEVRPLPWLMRTAEAIYDARYRSDALALQNDQAVDRFPEFVISVFMRESGIDDIVEKKCWALLCSTEFHRSHAPEAEVFGRFLSEIWDVDALLFYLRCRSEVMSATKTTLGARWATEPSRRAQALVLSTNGVQRVARSVWRERCDELVDTVEAFRETAGRVEASRFLELAVGAYVRHRDDANPDVAAFLESKADSYVSDVPLSAPVVREIRGEVLDFLRTATCEAATCDEVVKRLPELRSEAAALVDALAAYAAEHSAGE